MQLPPDDPQRRVLHDEVHARPPARLKAPERVAHLALRIPADGRATEERAILGLASRFGVDAPRVEYGYAAFDCGAFRFKWERHTEFTGLTFYRHVAPGTPDEASALEVVPADWLASLPGTTMVALHVSLDVAPADAADARIAAYGDVTVVGSQLGEGVATALTDLKLRPDGFVHIAVLDHGMSPRQAGRFVQRLTEVETYRMMALLAFPVAREVGASLAQAEARLAQATERMVVARGENEAALLEELTLLAAEVERSESANRFRFGAAQAYYRLMRQRIEELREVRIPGVQMLQEFMDRRLAPAMATCESVANRQSDLSARIARASQLLRTRVDVALERQNQSLLESMDRRARLQLRLQQTVEGLSIAAITYYVASLAGYLAKAARSLGAPVDPDVAVAVAVPVVALAAWSLLKRFRRHMTRAGDAETPRADAR